MRRHVAIVASLVALTAGAAQAQEAGARFLPEQPYATVSEPLPTSPGGVYYIYQQSNYFACPAKFATAGQGCAPIGDDRPDAVVAFEGARAAWIDIFAAHGCYFETSTEGFATAEVIFAERGLDKRLIRETVVTFIDDGHLQVEGDAARMIVGCTAAAGQSAGKGERAIDETATDESAVRDAIGRFMASRACVYVDDEEGAAAFRTFMEGEGLTRREVGPVIADLIAEGAIIEKGDRFEMVVGCAAGSSAETGDREAEIRAAIGDFFQERNCLVMETGALDAELEAFFAARGMTEDEVQPIAQEMMNEGLITEDGDRMEMVSGCVASETAEEATEEATEEQDVAADPMRAAVARFMAEQSCVYVDNDEGSAAFRAFVEREGLSRADVGHAIEAMLEEGVIVENGDRFEMVSGCVASETAEEATEEQDVAADPMRAAVARFMAEQSCVYVDNDEGSAAFRAFVEREGLSRRDVGGAIEAMIEEGVIVENGDRFEMVVGCEAGPSEETGGRDAEIRAALGDFFQERNCLVIESRALDDELEAFFSARGMTKNEVIPVADAMMNEGLITEQGDRIEMVSGCVASETAEEATEEQDVAADPMRAAVGRFMAEQSCVYVDNDEGSAAFRAFVEREGLSRRDVGGAIEAMIEEGVIVENGDRFEMVSGCVASETAEEATEEATEEQDVAADPMRAAVARFMAEQSCVYVDNDEGSAAFRAFVEREGLSRRDVGGAIEAMIEEGVIVENGDRFEMVSGCP